MGVFVDYLTVTHINIAPINTLPLIILDPDTTYPIIVTSIVVTNLGQKQPIRFSLASYYQDPTPPPPNPVQTGFITNKLLIPTTDTEDVNHFRSCNVLERVGLSNIHLEPNNFLACFVEGTVQKFDLRMDYMLLKNL